MAELKAVFEREDPTPMKFVALQDCHGPGNQSIFAGAEVDGHTLAWPIAPTFKALDQEAADALSYWYGQELRHLIIAAPGLRIAERYQPPPAPIRRAP